ncbi:hypothetical protein F7725_001635 [Dissostichus mawsoni]|uniref:THAP-type domain-containing protein n=1 Tax=Dissostichus mawsoni TaxID=36200 RepID=A0A7J5Y082_DISMA|nr:hypothetical protein F7725_001635 [Dissostichus mawsoni]
MPSRCVAANCSNTNKDGVSLFKFPKELSLRSQWTAQVQRTRQGWSPSTSSSVQRSFHRDRPESDASEFIQSSAGSSDGESDMDAGHDNGHNEEQRPRHQDNIYLIYWNCLLGLFAWCSCPSCGSKQIVSRRHEIGTLLIVTIICQDCGRRSPWHSQPYLGSFAAGNIMLSASILFAGATATKVLRVLTHMGVATISTRSFFRHQQSILCEAIQRLWRERQTWMMSALQADHENIVCGGDGRADTPGHSAKYGTYTLMELQKGAVIDVEVVQEHSNSTFTFFITGIKKKLQTLAKNRDCQTLKPWVSSIVNHLYWSVVSTPAGDSDLIVAKWKSVVSHIQNRHNGFGEPFASCAHPDLNGREVRKPWLTPCKTILAALHFNENSQRAQQATRAGNQMYSLHYPKYKQGGHIVRKVLDNATFGK